MSAVRHLIVEGSSSSVDGGGAGTTSYHTLYLPHAIQETDQKSFASDGAFLPDMVGRQSAVVAAFKDGLNILFIQAGKSASSRQGAPNPDLRKQAEAIAPCGASRSAPFQTIFGTHE